MTDFNKAIWKAKLKFDNLKQKAAEWGVESIYSLCIALTLWPALDALQTGDFSLMLGVGAAVGTNLIANQFDFLKGKSPKEQSSHLFKAIKENKSLRHDVQKLLEETNALNIALSQNAEDRDWLKEKLDADLVQWGQAIKVDRSTNNQGVMENAIANTGDNPIFNVTIVEKQEIVYLKPDPHVTDQASVEADRQAYLKQLFNHCQALPLNRIGEADTKAAQVKLNNVYIDLLTDTPENTSKTAPFSLSNSVSTHSRLDGMSREKSMISAWEAAQESDLLVILGDPGSGKSSFAKHMLSQLCLAELNKIDPLPGFPIGLTPVLVTLRKLVPALQNNELPQNTLERKIALQNLILDQVKYDVENEYGVPAYKDAVAAAIRNGECYLVLDGFDEVPQDLRKLAREAVADILIFNPKRVLVTCRIRSYTGEAVLEAFDPYTLASLNRDQIEKFCHDWYRCQSEFGRVLPTEYADKAKDFFQAAIGDEKFEELAGNPMLLTTMAIVHQKGTRLPPERVKLFREVVEIMLFRWQAHHGNQHLRESVRKLLNDKENLLRAVEHLAFAAHQAEQGDGDEKKKSADLPRKLARDILEDHYLESAEPAEDFLDYVDQRSGILIGLGGKLSKPNTYAFPHRFLQEYLAGCHLISDPDPYNMVERFRTIANEGDFWDEAALLAFEELRHNRTSGALRFLADELINDCNFKDPCHHRQVMWSGQIGNLIGKKTLEDSGERGVGYLNKLKPNLLQTAQSTLLNPVDRADAADALDALGYVPEDLYTFVEIPGDEDIPAFWIGKYPVTNRQYARFLISENFKNESLWKDLPDLDAKGKPVGVWGDEGWRWLQEHIKGEDLLTPKLWTDGRFGLKRPGAPVVGVSWWEANAYSRWLRKNWEELEEGQQGLSQPTMIRLPGEDEWAQAAGGEANDRFAFGTLDNPQKEIIKYCNTIESRIGRTTQVWTYPQGKSPHQVMDMTGNVWEWQGNQWEPGPGRHVLRGGSFDFLVDFARCALRYGSVPDDWDDLVGFRLCLRP